jgi:hypothetical protein
MRVGWVDCRLSMWVGQFSPLKWVKSPALLTTQETRKNYAILLRAMGRDNEAKQMEEDV